MRSQIYEWFHGHGIPFSLSHEEMHRGYDTDLMYLLGVCAGNYLRDNGIIG